MNWIDESVAVGGWSDAQTQDVDIIIDVRPLFDGTIDVFEVMEAADNILALAQDNKILLRCFSGRDRAPFMAMLYLSMKYNIPYEEAYDLVRQRRPQTAFHWEWVEALRAEMTG